MVITSSARVSVWFRRVCDWTESFTSNNELRKKCSTRLFAHCRSQRRNSRNVRWFSKAPNYFLMIHNSWFRWTQRRVPRWKWNERNISFISLFNSGPLINWTPLVLWTLFHNSFHTFSSCCSNAADNNTNKNCHKVTKCIQLSDLETHSFQANSKLVNQCYASPSTQLDLSSRKIRLKDIRE